jgi:hypothetical protein
VTNCPLVEWNRGLLSLPTSHRYLGMPDPSGFLRGTGIAVLWFSGGGTVMEIKVLLCNCRGLCASFQGSDMNTLPFLLESELGVEYTVLHPQLCGQGGNAILEEVLRGAGPETFVLVGACAPETQQRLFKKLICSTGFEPAHFIAVDISGTDNPAIVERLREVVDSVLAADKQLFTNYV